MKDWQLGTLTFIIVFSIGLVYLIYDYNLNYEYVCEVSLNYDNNVFYITSNELRGVYDSYYVKHGSPSDREPERLFLTSIDYIDCFDMTRQELNNITLIEFRQLYPDTILNLS